MTLIEINGDSELLLVDDDPEFHIIFEYIYNRQNEVDNQLVGLKSGEECLTYLSELTLSGKNFPSLILMDINMPGLSGIETLIKIRDSREFQKVPVVAMLSSSNYQGDIDRSKEAGAIDYFEKPFKMNDLVLKKVS